MFVEAAGALVGREKELATLDVALEALADGSGGLLAVLGGAGLGKSRLLRELVDRAGARRWIVLAGRASEFESDLPFAPLVDALDPFLASHASELFTELDRAAARRLGAVFPALAAAVDAPDAALPAERHRTYRAIRTLLVELARERPLVLVIDDLHWADSATLELVSHLVRHPIPGRVLLALGLREQPGPSTLVSTLAAMSRTPGALRIEVRPLTRAEAYQMLDDALPDTARAELYEQSAGNPFFLEHLARAVGAQPGTSSVPPGIAAALAAEEARLSEDARAALRAAAVAGEPFTPDLAAAVAGLAEERVLATFDELVAAGLITPTEVPREHQFAHPIVRRSIYDATPSGWRLAAHARAAEELARRGAPAAALSGHVEHSAAHGDEAAIGVLLEAAAATVGSSPQACAHWLEVALRLLPTTADQHDRRLDLLTRRATALAAAGRLHESRVALAELEAALPRSSVALRCRVAIAHAKVDHLLGNHGVRDRLLAARSSLGTEATPDAVRLELELAADAFFTGDFAGMRDWVAQAVQHCAGIDDDGLAFSAAAMAGCAEYLNGSVPAALALLDTAAARLDSLADPVAAAHLSALAWFAWCEAFVERFDAAELHVDRGRALARSTGQDHLLSLLASVRAFCALERGQLGVAAGEAEDAAEAALLASNTPMRSWALGLACGTATVAGDLERALTLGAEAFDGSGEDAVSALARCYHGEAVALAGDVETGRDLVIAGGGGPGLELIEEPFRPRWFALLVECEVRRGDVAAAREWLDQARAAAAGGLPGRRAVVARAEATVALAAGDARAAAAAARIAAEAAGQAGCELERGRALRLEGGAAALIEAEAIFARCGAWRLRDDAAAALRDLGHRPTRPRRGGHAVGDAVLSAREAEVLELVARGCTNRQAAAELFLSEKTIETHLARVFAKLSVSSRAAAAAAWERQRATGANPGSP